MMPGSSGGASEPLVVSGNIVTMDPERPRAQAFAVRGGRIAYVGERALAREAAGVAAREVHYEGGAVLPGLINSHNHMLWTGVQRTQADLAGCRSIAELLDALRRYAHAHPAREWIVSGTGWHVEALAERRYPTRQELDTVSSDRPIYLPRVGHAAAANSEALRRARVGRETPDPAGGRIERDAAGEPTGLLLEPPAFNLVGRLVPPLTRDEYREALREVQKAYLAAGICGVIDPGLAPDDMAVYEDLWRAGQLKVRSVVMPLAQTHDDPEQVLAGIRAWGVHTGFGDERLKLGGVKLYVDGGASLGTALMREPYPDEKCQCGIQVTHTETFHRIAELCARTGWSLGVHAVGWKGDRHRARGVRGGRPQLSDPRPALLAHPRLSLADARQRRDRAAAGSRRRDAGVDAVPVRPAPGAAVRPGTRRQGDAGQELDRRRHHGRGRLGLAGDALPAPARDLARGDATRRCAWTGARAARRRSRSSRRSPCTRATQRGCPSRSTSAG